MKKTLTDILLMNAPINNTINLQNSIIEKDIEISDLKARVESLLEQNRNLEQERFELSVHMDKLNISAVAAAKNTNEEENPKLYSLAGWVSFDATNEAQLTIFNACKKLCVRLIEKNKVGEKSTITPLQLLQAFIHIIK
jgi:regulator of replication initiation timing